MRSISRIIRARGMATHQGHPGAARHPRYAKRGSAREAKSQPHEPPRFYRKQRCRPAWVSGTAQQPCGRKRPSTDGWALPSPHRGAFPHPRMFLESAPKKKKPLGFATQAAFRCRRMVGIPSQRPGTPPSAATIRSCGGCPDRSCFRRPNAGSRRTGRYAWTGCIDPPTGRWCTCGHHRGRSCCHASSPA